jgi:hypothetical protein
LTAKQAQVGAPAVDAYFRRPFLGRLVKVDALVNRYGLFPFRRIHAVLTISRLSQIAEAIVVTVAVDVVNLLSRPLSSH